MSTSSAADLRARIKENPFDYDAYRELLVVVSDSNAKHEIYKAFSSQFPLDESTWLEWLDLLKKDRRICSEQELETIYDASIKDYLSIKLICTYCEFHSRRKSVEEMRELYKNFAKLYGSHYSQGHLIWEAWISFERENNGSEFLKYAMQRRATAPLECVEQYWQEYSSSNMQDESSTASHREALKEVQERKMFEDAIKQLRGGMEENPGSPLTASNEQLKDTWLAYLAQQKKSHPHRKQTLLLHRAIADCCLSMELWERLIQESEQHESLGEVEVVFKQVLRNLPQGSGEIFASYIRKATELSTDIQVVKAIFAKARETLSLLADLCQPGICYWAFVRKHAGDPIRKEIFAELVDLFSRSASAKKNPRVSSALSIILRSNVDSDPNSWKKLLNLDPAFWWPQYLALSERDKEPSEVRSLYNQALHHFYGNVEAFDAIANQWLAYEVKSGGVDQYQVTRKVIASKREMSVRKTAGVAAAGGGVPTAKTNAPKKDAVVVVEKREKGEPSQKRMRRGSNVEESTEDVEEEEAVKASRPRQQQQQKSAKSKQQRAPGKAEEDEHQPHEDVINPKKIRSDTTNHIVFLPSLPDSATVESIKDFFTRLVKVEGAFVDKVQIKTRTNLVHPVTKESLTRYYCFVEFGGETAKARGEAALKATKLSGSDLDGFELNILLAKPPPSKREATSSAASGEDKMEVEGGGANERLKPANKPKSLLVPRALKVSSTKTPQGGNPASSSSAN